MCIQNIKLTVTVTFYIALDCEPKFQGSMPDKELFFLKLNLMEQDRTKADKKKVQEIEIN